MFAFKKAVSAAKKLCLSLVMVTIVFTGAAGAAEMTLWRKDAPALAALREYISAVTDPNGSEYIPPEDRIAVSDFDGTLFGELCPIYFYWDLFAKRVTKDPSYRNMATTDMKLIAAEIEIAAKKHTIPAYVWLTLADLNAQSYAGVPLDDFRAYIRSALDAPVTDIRHLNGGPRTFPRDMKWRDAFYKPMLEAVNLLIENGFTLYVVSGTDRDALREICAGVLNIPPSQYIGSDYESEYTGGRLVRTGRLTMTVVDERKVQMIAREIGKRPVLAFGNSSGDFDMAEYVTGGTKYRCAAFFVLADDDVRDLADRAEAARIRETLTELGYHIISMRDDWKRIY